MFAVRCNNNPCLRQAVFLRFGKSWRVVAPIRSILSAVLASVVLSTLLSGCRATPAPTAEDHIATSSLVGTWVGQMPPSRDGAVLDDVRDGMDGIMNVLLEVKSSTADGAISGQLTFCVTHRIADTETFTNAYLGKGAVPLRYSSGPGTYSLSLVDLSSKRDSIHAVLSGGEDPLAGYLRRQDATAFYQRCKPA
jgi:hypothetical protein